MFNPSFCQDSFKRLPARRPAVFPSGTHGFLVGDKRDPRGGHKRPSSGTHGTLVGDTRQHVVSQQVAKGFEEEGQKTQKSRIV